VSERFLIFVRLFIEHFSESVGYETKGDIIMRKILGSAVAALTFGLIIASPAQAHGIECEGNYQVQRNGHLIATPYCQDEHLAIVAAQYGIHVNFEAIRYNPSEKERVCRIAGHDNRVRDTCAPYISGGPRGRWN
jgi:hypothetical protein